MFFLFICIITFFSFSITLLQILRFCCGTPPQTRTEKMQGLSLPRLPIVSVEHNDLTNNRRLYQFAYFPIMFGKAGLEPTNSGSQSKEISTGSNGGANRDRTGDLLHAMETLSQLSYGPINSIKLYKTLRICQFYFAFLTYLILN